MVSREIPCLPPLPVQCSIASDRGRHDLGIGSVLLISGEIFETTSVEERIAIQASIGAMQSAGTGRASARCTPPAYHRPRKRGSAPRLRLLAYNSERSPFAFSFVASRNGASPNIREYSRLKWDVLLYPTLKAEASAVSPSSTISRLASSNRRRF
jgi:hypothetical protein